jgi:uncharacterized coiled-coil protein SlyX
MILQRLAVVIGGFAAGALARRWAGDAPVARHSVDRLAREFRAQARAHENRISRLEARTEEHDAKLKELPSAAQLVAAMDELLTKALSGLEGRLTAQSRSIETLQATVSQTDDLLERVLESLDTLGQAERANK